MTPHALGEILAVLIVNAIQAHAKNIDISTCNQAEIDLANRNYVDRALVLDFEDDGIGLVTSKTEEIFEPTYTSKPEKFGTGLGLFIARRLSRQGGGDLWYLGQGRKACGAVFRLVLPLF
jgi:two-component system NtrC family sensor kinase